MLEAVGSAPYREHELGDELLGCVTPVAPRLGQARLRQGSIKSHVIEHAFKKVEKPAFGSKAEIFDTMLRLHPLLKETFFLQTKEDDNDPYESMQFTVVIANSSGIYGLYSYREIFEFKEFWGIGSGRSFALGAMHAVWASAKTAKEVALAGMHAGCEFDKNSGGPIDIYAVKLKV